MLTSGNKKPLFRRLDSHMLLIRQARNGGFDTTIKAAVFIIGF
ncbi:MAG: hypothetical protein VB106_09710 [Clostridiaceae bacterium]|nr:hypothetical protein [Clostridiaceae bacterium]